MRLPDLSALALAASLGLAIAAHAQTAPAPPSGPGPGPGGPTWRHDGGREHREARRDARLQALHDVLAIRPDQEGAFQAFAAAMAPEGPRDSGDWSEGGGREGGPSDAGKGLPSTPERLDLMLKRFDAHSARLRATIERRVTATKTLYAALGPEQQRTLDALPRLSGRLGWGDREGPGGGGHGHGPGGPGPGHEPPGEAGPGA